MTEPRPMRSVLLGIAALARFRSVGFDHFGDTPQAFFNSLAPLLAFPLVGGLMLLLEGAPLPAFTGFLRTLVAVLSPAVLSHALASLWQREALWLRYAVAINWCQFAMTVLIIAVLALAVAVSEGTAEWQLIVAGAMMAVVLYWLALCWFMAWRGLRLSALRAAGFVIWLNFGTAALVVAPEQLGRLVAS
jgi:hypothetical protein